MAGAEFEIQKAVYERLTSSPQVMGLVNGIYDEPPADCWRAPVEGFVTLGESQTLRDDATCLTGGQTYLTMHAWSRKVGYPAVKEIAGAVEDALHLAPLNLPSHRLISIMHRQTRTFRDPDGLTSHSVIEFLVRHDRLA